MKKGMKRVFEGEEGELEEGREHTCGCGWKPQKRRRGARSMRSKEGS